MANIDLVEDEVTEVPTAGENGALTLQNLGPGTVYVDTSDDVSEDTGLKLEVDAGPFPLTAGRFYVVAVGGVADLRYFDGS